MPYLTNTLNVIKFELTTAFLYSLINQNEFVLAEAYCNKCLTLISTLDKSEWDNLACVMNALQAHIGAKTNNIDMLLRSLNSTLPVLPNDLESFERICHLTKLPDSCMLAGQHFEQADRIDIAIKYYLQALRLSVASKRAQEIKTLLTSLNGRFSKHLADYANEQQFNNILQTVKCYPQASRFDLYFVATEYATLFKAILKKNDILTQDLRNSTTNIAIMVSYDLDADVFKIALTKTQKQISKSNVPNNFSFTMMLIPFRYNLNLITHSSKNLSKCSEKVGDTRKPPQQNPKRLKLKKYSPPILSGHF